MTTYTYQVTSDRPLAAFTGIGNLATIMPSDYQGITQRDAPVTVHSNGAAAGAGSFTIELTDRSEP